EVTVTSAFFPLAFPGDSGPRQRSNRAVITDFVAAIIGAFVRTSVRLSAATVDRISFRTEPRWTITRNFRTPFGFVRGAKSSADAHVFFDRFTSTAESPGEMKVAP